MEQKKNNEQKADAKSVSQPIAKPLVVRSPNGVSTEKTIEETRSPIEILREICQRDEDGFLILTPDINIRSIVESTGAKWVALPKIESQNEILNKGNQEQ